MMRVYNKRGRKVKSLSAPHKSGITYGLKLYQFGIGDAGDGTDLFQDFIR